MPPFRTIFAVPVLLACHLLLQPVWLDAAAVRPLEIVSGKIYINELEYLATEHVLASIRLRKTIDRLNREMNVMSRERIDESLKLIDRVREALALARKTSSVLSVYIAANSQKLKAAGHGDHLPLANIDRETEAPYFTSLEKFLGTASQFVRYCGDNLEAITGGQPAEGKRYEELYAAYLRDMESFNSQSIARSQRLADFGSEHPALWDFLPR